MHPRACFLHGVSTGLQWMNAVSTCDGCCRRKLLEKHRGSQHLFLKLYAPGVADRPAQAQDGTESSMGDLWMQRWMPEYDQWFAIDDHKAMAAQVCNQPVSNANLQTLGALKATD